MRSLVYVVIAAVAAGAGYGIYRYGIQPRLVAPQAAPAQALGPAVRPQEASDAAAVASDVPTTLPEFSLQDRAGQMRSIRGWPGKSLIVNFWATWCAPCRREIPLLQQMQKEHGAAGFQVVGVAIDFRDDVLKFAKEIGMNYPLLIGEQDGMEAAGKFGLVTGLPFTVFTDTQGRIVVKHLGELSKPQSEILIAIVGRVNKGELTPAAAQVVATKQLQELEPVKG